MLMLLQSKDDADTPMTEFRPESRHSVSSDTMIGGESTLDALSVLLQMEVEDASEYVVSFGSITSVPVVRPVAGEGAGGEGDEDAEGCVGRRCKHATFLGVYYVMF